MKKSQFSEEQIITILGQSAAGKSVDDICREHKISTYTFYKWKRKFSGMSTSEAKRLKELEAENAKLKRLVANQALDITVLKDALGKKW
jgi:putative transposase